MNIDLKETHETSASQLTSFLPCVYRARVDSFILFDPNWIKLIHARMCAYNCIFGYKSVARVLLCFNPNLVCYSPFCEFTLHVQYNLVRCLLQCNTFFYVGIFACVK